MENVIGISLLLSPFLICYIVYLDWIMQTFLNCADIIRSMEMTVC